MKLKDLESWMTSGQVADKLHISRQTALHLARDGRIRAVLVGRNHEGRGTWAYDPQSVQDHARTLEAKRGSNG